MSNVSFIPGFVSLSFYVLIILSVTDLVLSCGFARLYERSHSSQARTIQNVQVNSN